MPSMGGHGPTTIQKTWPFLVLHVMTVEMYFSHGLCGHIEFFQNLWESQQVPLPGEWGTSGRKQFFDDEMNSQVLTYIQNVELCFLLLHVKHMVSFDMQCKQTN